MTKLKILDINKQLKVSAETALDKNSKLLIKSQKSVSVVKKLEAEVIKRTKQKADEARIKAEKEQIEAKSKETVATESKNVASDVLGEKDTVKENVITKVETVKPSEPVKQPVEEAKEAPKPKVISDKKPDATYNGSKNNDQQVQQNRVNNKSSDFKKPTGNDNQARRSDNKSGNYNDNRRQYNNTNSTANRQPNRSNDKNGQYNKTAGSSYNSNRPNNARPTNTRPNNARPNNARPNNAGPNNARPNNTRPTNTRPNNARPNNTATQNTTKKTVANKFENSPNKFANKSPYNKQNNNQKGPHNNNRFAKKNKRSSFNRHNIDIYQDDQKMRGPRKAKKQKENIIIETKVITHAIITTEEVSVKVLAEKTGKPVAEMLKKLLLLGMMCNINSEIDFDTAQLICDDFNITLEQKIEKTAEEVLGDDHKEEDDDVNDLEERPPVVTIMGHVDHGKTSLLDAIRSTKVTEGEAGGITQHIGAYTVEHEDQPITFLDTPGHEAFTAMRARGAQATDIAILVVAADDGVMPQTVEAINHAKDAGVPIIVAINKIDRPAANIEKIKQELTEHSLVAEEWGGDVIMVPVSAITKEGIGKLLEMILLQAEMGELKANPNRLAKGTIIEAKLDKGRGPVATVLVTNGTLKVQDAIVAGTTQGRIRAMVNDKGETITSAGPSIPVEVIGFSEVPAAGDIMHVVDQDKLSRKVVEERKNKQKAERLKNMSKVSLDDLFDKIAEGQLKNLNIIVKADVQGSAEALRQALEKIESDEVKINVKHAGVGAVAEADVMLASVSNAIIIGFNVRPDNSARIAAAKENVDIRMYRVIYDAIEDVEKAMIGMLEPEYKEFVIGHIEVRELFKVSSVGTIAGCYVTDGKVNRNSQLRLTRDNIVIHEGEIGTLRRFKDDVKEVVHGYECGVSIDNYNDIKIGDIIEAFEMRKVAR